MNTEIWKPIPGHDPRFAASSLGNIRSQGMCRNGYRDRILTQRPIKRGYLQVWLNENNTGTNYYVHRLVAAAFHGAPEFKMEVNHLNGITSDNRPENLQWVTRSQNLKHAFDFLGRRPWNKPMPKTEGTFQNPVPIPPPNHVVDFAPRAIVKV